MGPLFFSPLSVEQPVVGIRDLPADLAGTRIVQLSDLHFDGQRLSLNLLQQAINRANEAEPDLVVLTGDYVTDEPEPIHTLARHLKALESRLGTYAILGNHDLYFPQSQAMITDALEQAGIHVLWDAIAHPFGPQFPLVGLRDYWSFRFNPGPVFAQLSAETPRLVLSHNPDSAHVLRQWRVDLQLSGHTHGGQIVLPGYGPLVACLKPLRRKIPKNLRPHWRKMTKGSETTVQYWQWAQGLHQIDQNWLYVNRGLGTYWPGRINCPPELTILTLECA
ncbi:metallophosphoesterase [Candidatus Synechococcus calcipolaris G9]|uniref:Metallophosphoesterase n=1 Tax=Candidatus Synechococcus calcipolaris G9 TaxID=1497997 RepID=A0ABT6F1Y6_9SYNE|nr:metallophosphoesterase [Candidatus Synechococcus calcipolaris]MDG2991837.1 metallophosphoesterase [Candidatus Synechococcus calcipolaris G9]